MSSTNRTICKAMLDKGTIFRNGFQIGDLCSMCVVRDKLSCPNLKEYLEKEAALCVKK